MTLPPLPRLLVVCEGNVCRSPLAAAMLAAKLPRARVGSAGLAPPPGRPADPLARDMARARGLSLDGHTARPVTTAMSAQADLIFVMDHAQRRALEARHPLLRGRVFRLGEFARVADGTPPGFDIFDPYRGTRDDFVRCAALIDLAVGSWLPRLAARWPQAAASFHDSQP
ncbi:MULTISPECIES: low molecular weight protein-tyrosine-phosphatase [Burkholderia]|uniref:low molecular weight protein-tyrosine-phosphatase n=1 Tax=Burkholderia TaxID=32008 RepID=UPI000863C3B8|nr:MULTISPECIES: low molecular weight protein-tyrosine-phosphatase [Burkholderia]AOL05803.1 protein tyrosine phosphatase [Burkholderia contaminans]TCW66154.1 low molecular weight phosphotyrosine protein phosphatase [Burkholderia sp. SRS-25]